MALLLVLFGTVGCNEEVQAPEPLVEVSAAEALQELKTQFRKENDALAFHLRLHDGNFQSQDLVRSYLSEHYGPGSSALGSYELAIANASGASFRVEGEESPFTEAAQAQVDYYINAVAGYDDPNAYIGFLEGEFHAYLNTDLEDPTNLGVALWLALQTESVDFVVDNLDLLIDTSGGANGRVDGWFDDIVDGAKKWWNENKRCIIGVLGSAGAGAITGCGALWAMGAKIGTLVGGPAGTGIGIGIGCAVGVLGGSLFGGMVGYATFCDD